MKNNSAKKKKIVVAVSGGFDPIHIGHVRLFERARELGDELVVILNNDHWLRAKKQHVFMPAHERMEVIRALRPVDRVVLTKHGKDPKGPKDMSVSRELRMFRPDVFANGGDRDEKNAADPKSSLYWDINTCGELGTKMIFGVGRGGKLQSSSWLLEEYVKKVAKRVGGSRAKKGAPKKKKH
jgi:D-beta-D-heptose 7-phosphate kinase/D-beta-D-heptose 1-phosphate adenosyltransferase